jgi:CheY-like chemotaxis protein
MILGLGVNVDFVEQNIDFDTRSLSTKRSKALYHPTLKKISDHGATKLIIPGHISGCDYNYEKIIEHIRTDSNKAIAMIPILVYFEDEEKYLKIMEESDGFLDTWFEKISVAFTTDPKIEEFISIFDKNALEAYLDKSCKHPYSRGSHDKSNFWGSLSLLKSLLSINLNNEALLTSVSELENNLSEQTYYKRLIREFDSNNVDKNYLVRLRSESSKIAKTLNDGTVLIIEDQLKDGWEVAYSLFFSLSSNFKVLFAENESEAKEVIEKTSNIDLILLDVRLDRDRDAYNQDEHGHHVEKLSGVKLAKWIRDKIPTTPIIAATASNKSWTLEALLEQGINGYWVKGSPDLVTTVEIGIENTIDLCKKINDTLAWSQKTGNWQKELYRIADIVDNMYLRGKAKSLQALLFRSFSPFSNDLSDGLQMNLAFMNIYSCMNDLVEWACDIKEVEPNIWKWSTIDFSNKYVNIVRVEKGLWFSPNKSEPSKVQPDKDMAIQVIDAKFDWSYTAKEFRRLTQIRNALPLVHGRRMASGSVLKSLDAKISDVNSLIDIFGSLVDRHKESLDKYGK